MRDLSSLDLVGRANDGFDLSLYDPGTLDDLGIVIRILGRDSAEYRKLQSEQNRRRMAKMSKSGQVRVGAISMEEFEQDTTQLLAACTKAWRTRDGELYKDVLLVAGIELTCTQDNVLRVYTDFHWIKEQVETGVTDRANFIKR